MESLDMKTRTRRILAAINDSMESAIDCEAATRSITTALSASIHIDHHLTDLIEQYAVLRFTHRRLASLRSLTRHPITNTDDKADDLHRKAVRTSEAHASAIHEWMHCVSDELFAALEALPE
jgi:hypothetical protein